MPTVQILMYYHETTTTLLGSDQCCQKFFIVGTQNIANSLKTALQVLIQETDSASLHVPLQGVFLTTFFQNCSFSSLSF